MASSLFLLLDDITTLLDDVAAMTKVAAGKTAGVLGDDLALNAEQVAGVVAERELPVVWAVAKGSFVNKAILVPAALVISAFAPWAITPLLMCGGVFLCYEGFEKLAHKYLHPEPAPGVATLAVKAEPVVDPVTFEKEKIKGAIRTDFILSAEIIVITLGTVAHATLLERSSVLATVAVLMTVGVYGLVAGIVKLDDIGAHLLRKTDRLRQAVGRGLLIFAPFLMKVLSTGGMIAMFLVGGGILTHGFHALSEFSNKLALSAGPAAFAVPLVINAVVGLIAGAAVLGVVLLVKRFRKA